MENDNLKYKNEMNNKEFSAKQVYILVFVIVTGIAFMETSYPMWTGEFWKEFSLKVLGYGIVSEFIIIFLAQFLNKEQ